MSASLPFNPHYGSGQVVASGTAASVTLAQGDKQVCITNQGANVAYVRVTAAGNATNADYPVQPGAQVVITKADDDVRLNHLSAGTTLHIMTGNGW